ncbi:MAG: Mov34/MPN/PAD-1 family protein [Candidatus Hodarchaeota archaeon]
MIRIPKDAYTKFVRFALENANPYDHKNWKECIGLILGRILKDESINVTDIVPIGVGSAIFVDITDFTQVFSLISSSRIDQGEVIVGWAHTHPGLGLFLSSTDIQTQQSYQRMHPKAFALVLDPTKIENDYSGFNIYRLDSTLSQPQIVEYEFDEKFNYQTIKNKITTDLYLIPAIPRIVSTETSVSWKNITLKIDGPSECTLNKPFDVKISIYLPFRQFVRVEYQIITDDLTNNLISSKLTSQNHFFHETITSGTLGIYNLDPMKKGRTNFTLTDLYLSDYKDHHQKMPEIGLKTNIE